MIHNFVIMYFTSIKIWEFYLNQNSFCCQMRVFQDIVSWFWRSYLSSMNKKNHHSTITRIHRYVYRKWFFADFFFFNALFDSTLSPNKANINCHNHITFETSIESQSHDLFSFSSIYIHLHDINILSQTYCILLLWWLGYTYLSWPQVDYRSATHPTLCLVLNWI